ncbi:MAG: hypothetical protein ACTS2F_00890 [Thainema sp.]
MFLRSVVLAIVVVFLSLPLPLFGSSAIASPRWPAAPSASTVVMQNFPTVNSVSQAGQVWRQVKRWMPDSSKSAIASTSRPIASMSYPVKRAIPRILNSLMQTIVQCFRQFLWIATRQMQGLDYQWQTLDAIRPDSNLWSVRSEG